MQIFLQEGGTYIDARANIGVLALKASSLVGDKGTVFAIETHPQTYDYLKQNYLLNNFSNYSLHNKALGSEQGEIFFSDNNSDDQNHVLSQGRGIRVDMIMLDSITTNLAVIDLLKIDVEGFELQVVKGAIETLKKAKALYIEVYEENFKRYNYSTPVLLDEISNRGFHSYRIVASNPFKFEKIDKSYIPTKVENIICVKDDISIHPYL